MFKNYYEVRDWLESFIPQVYTKENLGLARIRYLLELLGNPQNKFKSIHIAGTSGKGSTAYYTARLLAENFKFRIANFKLKKVGLHVSPHLVDIRERMQIDGKLIKLTKFIKLIEGIRPVVEKIEREKPEFTPSYFEILVAASFLYFAQERVDWAVVEVGLGGRLDATNVLVPGVSVITNIGLDHTDILGKTVEKIAFEKAGIIKKGVPVVTGVLRLRSGSSTSGRALRVIADVARKQQAPLITVDTQKNADANKFLALAAVRAVGVRIEGKAVETAFEAKFVGRFEEIERGVILDGAHNPDKIQFLIRWIKKQLTTDKLQLTEKKTSDVSGQMSVVLVLAFKKVKDWRKMVDLLIKNLPIKKVIATKFYAVTDIGKYQAVEPEEIARYIKSVYRLPTTVDSNSQEAVFDVLRLRSGSSTLVLVTGSLYLVGEVRTMWRLPEF